MNARLLEALDRGPLLLDAGMGTRLIARGLGRGEASAWNLERPDDVLEIHRLDVEAGSDAILTNTFCAGRSWLARFDLADKTAETNARGVELARLAGGPDRLVLGSIGPTARGDPASLIEQAEALAGAGVDALVLETHTFDQAEAATQTLRGRFALPIVASLFDWPEAIGEAARRLLDAGASVIGVNCVLSMDECLRVARKLHQASPLPILVKPGIAPLDSSQGSAGLFADAVPDLLANGVRLIGGCCGTTEAHVAAMRARFPAPRVVQRSLLVRRTPHPNPPPQGGRGPERPANRLGLPPSPLAGEGRGGGFVDTAETLE